MWFSCALFLDVRFPVSRQQKWTFSFVAERPRSPMAARGAIHAGRGTSPSMERDAGSHSVHRIVRLFCLLTDPAPAGMDCEKCSDSVGLGIWHLIELYFFGVWVIAKEGIKPKSRFDRRKYISAKLISAGIYPWEVMPAPPGPIYPARESGKTEWHWSWFS
jgi:hypothetical protein